MDLVLQESENDEDVEFVLAAAPQLLVQVQAARIPNKTQHLLQTLVTCKGVS